jgi:predicted ribosomally synthesized peptide with nif11-like leader
MFPDQSIRLFQLTGLEVKMNTDSAQLFVQKMKEDKKFRSTVQDIGDTVELWEYIENKGYAFDACDLVKAMAACMAELEAGG